MQQRSSSNYAEGQADKFEEEPGSSKAGNGLHAPGKLRDVELGEPGQKHSINMKDVIFWFVMLFIASATMTVGNKVVMMRFKFANTLTLLQNGSAVVILGIGKLLNVVSMKPFAIQQWKVFAVSAILLSMQILTSLMALPLVAIATVVAFRNACTVAIATIDFLFFGNSFSPTQISALCLTTIGMLVYAKEDLNFNAVGYLWLLGNSMATISNTFWNKIYITHYTRTKKIQTSFGVSFIQQVETLPLMLFLAITNGEVGAFSALVELPISIKFAVLVTCFGGVLISMAYPKCFSLASGTSVVVASTCNKAASIIIGMFVFGTVLSKTQVFGLTVCICGGLWYSVDQKQSQASKKQASA